MKIYLSDQSNHFKRHLDHLKSMPVMPYNASTLPEKISAIDINTVVPWKDLDLQCLFDYRIFPDNIMTGLTEWSVEKRTMREGDTIVQQVYIPPIHRLSQKIVFGVRIREIILEENRMGFSYETLEGHVERGISVFTVEPDKDRTLFKIYTRSQPGNRLSRMLGPVFSVPYQAYCTGKALHNVKKQLEEQ